MVSLTDQPKGGGMPAVQTRQVVEGYLRGHGGSLFGEAPSGRSVRVPMAAFYEVKHGEIVAGRLYYDTGCLSAQLGGPDRSEGTSSPGGSAPRRPR
jgi:hypothetical protein